VARAVEVDSRAITEALKQIYHADALLNELTGGQPVAMKPNPQNRMRKPANRP